MRKYLCVSLLILVLALAVGCTEKVNSDAALPVVGEASEPAAEAESEPETVVEEAVVEEPVKEGIQIIGSDGFSPEKLTVKVGDTVVFTNKALPADKVKDAVLVIQNTQTKQTKTPGKIFYGASYEHTFDKAGTYSVWTVAYAAVKGTVIVE
ncbi:MAG: plastocyanin/azurin family copper-binding protein [Nanoarchaeota archaeon]